MLLLIDYSNLAQRCAHLRQVSGGGSFNYGLLPYLVFEHALDWVIESAAEAGEPCQVILALDSHDGYWRKEIYPPYKADRAKKRAEDGIDWPRAFELMDKLSTGITAHLPWQALAVPHCEADDVIAVLSRNYEGRVVIHSGDSDYIQLVSDRVALFSPHRGEKLTFPAEVRIAGTKTVVRNAEEYLYYAILTGQGGKDNVYNVLTPTDWVSEPGKRKPGFGVAAARKVAAIGLDKWLKENDVVENCERNRKLIDLACIPEQYEGAILAAWKALPTDRVPDVDAWLADWDWPSYDDQTKRAELANTLCLVAGIEPLHDEAACSLLEATEMELQDFEI